MTATETILEGFERWLQEKRKPQTSSNTAAQYGRYAKLFCSQYGPPAKITEERIASWEGDIQVTKKGGVASPTTVNVKIAAIRALFEYLISLGVQKVDLSQALTMQKVPERLPKPVDLDILEQLFKLVQNENEEIALQDLAMFEVLFGSGLRRNEAAQLCLRNLDTRRSLKIIGKGNKERRTVLTSPGYEALKRWVLKIHGDERTAELVDAVDADAAFTDLKKRKPDAPIFRTTRGTPLPELKHPGDFIYQRTEYYAKKLGTSFAPHQMRHSWFTYLLDNGADIFILSQSGGHAKLDTTKGYIKVLNKGLNSLRTAHPREKSEAYV